MKINIVKSTLGLVLVSLLAGCSNDEKQTVTTKFNLVFQDEFDVNGAPDPTKWTFDIGRGPLNDGWGNNELQFYKAENTVVQNGYLIISAKAETFGGVSYTSSRIKSRNKFEQKYGRFEARIKMPQGKGMFPAFWLLGQNFCEAQSIVGNNVSCDSSLPSYEADNVLWPQCGEIDIMEYLGNKPTEVFGTIHGPGYSGGNSISKKYNLANNRFDTGFHVFGIEWTENHINWYVDDVLYNQITRQDVEEKGGEWVFDNSFYMLLNLAVGGNLPGSPNAETTYPQRMLVDYVRVYQ
ncbi:glycoside hydrolase family 16 protein [Flavobacterium sp.]|uniref:glycoside hydrolase family 16 protein n=1 Tax=Flavobacterium sp. TaxID=239 RepID=UPI00260537F7|nr:glycoside hydrolase family 16 protein [Flavobacterium sp.]